MSRVANTIAAAETLVASAPVDAHGFALAANVEFREGVVMHTMTTYNIEDHRRAADARRRTIAAAPDRRIAVQEALSAAGYEWSTGTQQWERPGYVAVASGYDWAEMSVCVYAAKAPQAMATGEDGYLPSGSRP